VPRRQAHGSRLYRHRHARGQLTGLGNASSPNELVTGGPFPRAASTTVSR
jgi:hypothetical protein